MTASRYTKAELVRALEGVKAAGLPVSKVEIDPDGTIRLFIGEGSARDGANALDLIDWRPRRKRKDP